jgi:conjugative relaxase-like TrwC/TraI family protein
MLSIGKLGAGRAAAEYYLARQAGCSAEYYTGSGERRGVWLGRGAAALGLSGDIDEVALRHLLAGRCPDGSTVLIESVLRADPRGRLSAGPLAAHVRHLATQRDIPADQLLNGERGEALGRVMRAVARDHRTGGPPRATVRIDVAAGVCRALGLNRGEVYGEHPGAFDAALAYAGERVDVRVAGFDVTLSAPKSVSVLYGLADPGVAEAVRGAHGRAVTAAIKYLEAEAGSGLRGHHGDGHTARTVASSGFIGAAFQHRANRCGDPQLHTHVVVANLVLGVDGRASALDSRSLYAAGKTAGYLYQAVLRHELKTALRVQWTPVRRGVGELAGIPAGLCRVFSKRRAQIEALLAGIGRTDPKAAQEATLATRPAKDRGLTGGAEVMLRERWAAEARSHGHDPMRVTDVLRRGVAPRDLTTVELDRLVGGLAGSAGLTLHRSTFDRREVVRAVCAALPAGASAERLQTYTTAVRRRLLPRGRRRLCPRWLPGA